MDQVKVTDALLSDAFKQWCSLLHTISTDPLLHTAVQTRESLSETATASPNTVPVHWKKTLLDISSRKKSMGVTLKQSHFGVMVLNFTPDSPLLFLSSLFKGALLMEINGVTVLLETFESITKTLNSVTTTGK